MPTAAISVPISSEPPSISFAPAKSTTTVAMTPRNSIAGKKIDDSFWAWTFETRFASLRSPNSRLERALPVERLHDRHPGDRLGELRGDGGDPRAHVGERDVRTRSGTSASRRCPGGSTISATTPSRQSSRKSPPIAATSVSELTTSVVRPWLRTSESASTSLVRRAMIQPAFCCEK